MTTKVYVNVTNLSSGYLDLKMIDRVDLKAYDNGCQNLINMRGLVQGGLKQKPGTDYIADVGYDGILQRFVFNLEEAYVFVFYNAGFKVYYDDDGSLAHTAVGMPWTTGIIEELRFSQRLNTLFVMHESFDTVTITRTGLSTFTVDTTYSFELDTYGNQTKSLPYYKFASPEITLAVAAGAFTASANYFVAGMFGENIRIKKGSAYEYYKIGSVSSGTSATATALSGASGAVTATTDWGHQAIGPYYGYPIAGTIYEGRMVFAGTKSLPSHEISSKTGSIYNFDTDDASKDDSIFQATDTEGVSNFRHIFPYRHLLFFADSAEFYQNESSQGLIPGDGLRKQQPYGTSNVRPIAIDSAVLHVQRTGQIIREFIWNELTDGYDSNPISIIASDKINNVRDSAAQYGSSYYPEQYAFFINGDGTLMCYHTIRKEKISGWYPWETRAGDEYRSVCEVNDRVYFLMKRSINGSTKYYLERMNPESTLECSKSYYTGVSSYSFTGYSHLEGESVEVVYHSGSVVTEASASYYLGSHIVSSGTVTVESEMATDKCVNVGLYREPELTPMPGQYQTNIGNIYHRPKRLGMVTVSVLSSLSLSVSGGTLIARQVTDDPSIAPSQQSKIFKFFPIGVGRRIAPTLSIPDPLPCTITGMTIEYIY